MTRSALPALALGAALALAGCGGGVPSVVRGTITSTAGTVLTGGEPPSGCILNLPSDGSQVLLKADGTTVAVARLARGSTTRRDKYGETCSIAFTFTGVPGGHQIYEVTVDVNNSTSVTANGCQGTVYFTPAQLSRPLALSC